MKKYITPFIILITSITIFYSCSKSDGELLNDGDEQVIDDKIIKDPTTFDPNSSTITNDIWWADNNGEDIQASMGGHITKVGDTYYWVGNNQNYAEDGADIHMYSSKTLGSNSWKNEGKMIDFPPGEGAKNCTLLHCPHTNNFVIIAKSGLVFYESENVTGPYTKIRTILKNQVGGRTNYKVGGMGTFQDGANAYIITSRRWLGQATDTKPLNHRYTGIYKLTPDFLDVDEEIAWLRNDAREAMWLFKKDNTYYMTASHTAGWTASNCYYRTSKNLVDWSEEYEIGMSPDRPGGTQEQKIMRSHGTQQRWIQKFGNQWIYAGDRYPYQEKESHPFEKGLYLMCPVIWEGDKPIVKYEELWDVSI